MVGVKELTRKIRILGSGAGKQDWVSPASVAEHGRQTEAIMPKLTDFPRGEVEEDPVGFVSRIRGISRDAKDRIMFRNAARIFYIRV